MWHELPQVLLLGFILWVVIALLRSLQNASTIYLPRVYVAESSWLSRFTDKFRFLLRGHEAVAKGYKLFPNSLFRMELFGHGSLVAVDRGHMDEFLAAPESQISFQEGFDSFSLYLMFLGDTRNSYHNSVIRQMAQNLATSELSEELTEAFMDEMEPLVGEDYKPIVVFQVLLRIMARVVHRQFVGLPLCRDPEYLEAVIKHSTSAGLASVVLRYVPEILKRPILRLCFRDIPRSEKIVYQHLAPIIEERRRMMKHQGDNYKKPSDVIQWLIDSATGLESQTEYLISRILMLNTASLLTTALGVLHVIYDLADNTQDIHSLREELTPLVSKEGGWSKENLSKMWKLDSFVKESFRHHPLGSIVMLRKVMNPFTFSNGVTVPKGTTITAPIGAIHMDNDLYPNAETFDGLRFSKLREQSDSAKLHAANTSNEFLYFSHGKHACPGRFFAVDLIKMISGLTLLRYDIKTPSGKRPVDTIFQLARYPDLGATISIRKRK